MNHDESYSESEEILREIKQTTDPARLEELWEEWHEAIRAEDNDYTSMLMRVMK